VDFLICIRSPYVVFLVVIVVMRNHCKIEDHGSCSVGSVLIDGDARVVDHAATGLLRLDKHDVHGYPLSARSLECASSRKDAVP